MCPLLATKACKKMSKDNPTTSARFLPGRYIIILADETKREYVVDEATAKRFRELFVQRGGAQLLRDELRLPSLPVGIVRAVN